MMKNIYQFGSYALGKPMPRFSLAHFIRKLMTAIFHEVIIGHSSFTRISSRFVKAGSLLFLMTMFVSHLAAQSSEKLQISINEEEKFQTLQVGDVIPEEIWELPLQMVNHPENKQVITLGDYRDKKLIILDFWATWCGSCISGMEALGQVQNKLQDDLIVLPVTTQSRERIQDAFIKIPLLNDLNFLSVIEDDVLIKYFPHRMIPHLIWIGQSGEVLAVTDKNEASFENISSVINNESPNLVLKADILDFDNDSPLFFNDKYGISSQLDMQSVFCRHISGVPSSQLIRKGSEINRYLGLNLGFLSLYRMAFPNLPRYYSARIECSEGIRDLYLTSVNKTNAEYLYTYELITQNVAINRELEKIKEDLDFNFQVETSFLNKEKECLILVSLNDDQFSKQTIDDVEVVPVERFVNKLEFEKKIPVLNESNSTEIPSSIFKQASSGLDDLNALLFKHNLQLTKGIREIEVFFIKEVSI